MADDAVVRAAAEAVINAIAEISVRNPMGQGDAVHGALIGVASFAIGNRNEEKTTQSDLAALLREDLAVILNTLAKSQYPVGHRLQ